MAYSSLIIATTQPKCLASSFFTADVQRKTCTERDLLGWKLRSCHPGGWPVALCCWFLLLYDVLVVVVVVVVVVAALLFGCLLLLLLVTVVAVLLLVVAIVAVAIAAVADVFSKVSAQSCATADTIVHMFWFPILVSTANDQEWTMIFMLLPSHKSIIEKRYQKTWFVCRVDHLPPWKIISKYTLKK